MIIIGAGMAGLIASAMLRDECEAIIEAQPSIPDNHSAVLRFKSSIVGDTVGIPFQKVQAVKSYAPWQNRIADILAYSKKTNGDYQLRSIVSAAGDVVDRYVAPQGFTKLLVNKVSSPIRFNTKATKEYLFGEWSGDKMISTLPMPALMDLLDYDGPRPEFKSIPGVNITSNITQCAMQCSLYVPSPEFAPYRISLNGNVMIAEVALMESLRCYEEFLEPDYRDGAFVKAAVRQWWAESLYMLGISENESTEPTFALSRYQKILPVDNDMRERFIMWASDHHNIYSLGRFATWRPGVLLDHIVGDVRTIQRISKTNHYEIRKGVSI